VKRRGQLLLVFSPPPLIFVLLEGKSREIFKRRVKQWKLEISYSSLLLVK
jgi:hypothetical protein